MSARPLNGGYLIEGLGVEVHIPKETLVAEESMEMEAQMSDALDEKLAEIKAHILSEIARLREEYNER